MLVGVVQSLICRPGMVISELVKQREKGVSCQCLQLDTSKIIKKTTPQIPCLFNDLGSCKFLVL